MPKNSALAICVLAAISTLAACARGPHARAVSTVGSGAARVDESAAPSDPSAADVPPLPVEIVFAREYEDPQPQDDGQSSCAFNAGEISYDGLFYFKGRPFSSAHALGKISSGWFHAEENNLHAAGYFYTDHATITGDINLPEVPLYASGPIVHDEWLQIARTRIATKTSVKGAFFAPDVKLPTNVRLKTPLREDAYRIPCGFVSPNAPESSAEAFGGSTVVLDAPDEIVGISRTPDGASFAELVHPTAFNVRLISMYKTTALVAVDVDTRESAVSLVGWIHRGELNEEEGSSGVGESRSISHERTNVRINCNGVSVFATVEKKLYSLAQISSPHDLYGAYTEAGDFRVDLGAGPHWSKDHPPKDGPNEPLDAFIPKEYLPRCVDVK